MLMYGHGFSFEFQLLAAAGYAVVYANPRGSQGYGEAHCTAIYERWGDLDAADVLAALDAALAAEPRLARDRIAVAGGSYGGYLATWLVAHTERFKAGVIGRPVIDWRSMVASGDGGPDLMARAGGVPPWRDDAWYREQSPITYVDRITTPLLIEHGEEDLRCPIGQSEALFTAMKWLGKAPVALVRYPREFHAMARTGEPWHRVHRLWSIREWLDRYLAAAPPADGGRCDPGPMATAAAPRRPGRG